jgi:hypothetical protein
MLPSVGWADERKRERNRVLPCPTPAGYKMSRTVCMHDPGWECTPKKGEAHTLFTYVRFAAGPGSEKARPIGQRATKRRGSLSVGASR